MSHGPGEFIRVEWLAEAPGHPRRPFTLVVSRPEPHPEGDFACHVSFGDSAPRPIAGVDPLQVLVLALVYLRHWFEQQSQAGWRFFYADANAEEIDPLSYFRSFS